MIFPIDEFIRVSHPPPSYLIPWISCQSSLTDQLKELTGEASIEVLKEDWRSTNWWDNHVLHLGQQVVFHREIVMRSHQIPCWYARTIIPEVTYKAGRSIFSRLKTESLGALIFNEPDIKRIQLMHYPLSRESIEYHWLKSAWMSEERIVWLRLSTLMLEIHPFFLVEILLPGLERCSN